jgi:hypothetical protein
LLLLLLLLVIADTADCAVVSIVPATSVPQQVGYTLSTFGRCLGIAPNSDGSSAASAADGEGCDAQAQYQIAKLCCLAANFWFAFFNFSQAVRFITNLSFAINTAGVGDAMQRKGATAAAAAAAAAAATVGGGAVSRTKTVPPSWPLAYFDRATRHAHVGHRFTYLTPPLVAWLFGRQALLGAALATLGLLYYVDHVDVQLDHADVQLERGVEGGGEEKEQKEEQEEQQEEEEEEEEEGEQGEQEETQTVAATDAVVAVTAAAQEEGTAAAAVDRSIVVGAR